MNDRTETGRGELTPQASTRELAEPQPDAGPLGAILANPDAINKIPIETVERLFALHRQEIADADRRQFFAAMQRVRSRMRPVEKRANNTHTGSKYAKVEEIQQMLNPILNDEGFSYSISTVDPVVEDTMRVRLVLRHIGGHEEHHYLDAPVDDKGPKGQQVKTRLHGMGSTMTYCGRQLLTQVFGVMLAKDDDGNAAGVPDELVSEEQVANLVALIEEVGADRKKFCVYMRVPSLEEIPAREYRNACAALEAKR